MKRDLYRTTILRQRAGLQSMTDGLREYLTAPLDAELKGLEDDPPLERGEIIDRLTEDLMAANTDVQMVESQSEQIQNILTNLDPGTIAMIHPFMPLLNGILRPILEQMWMKAKRKRDDIESELMDYEEKAAAQLPSHPDSDAATDSTGGL